jgi:hypothetical protein
MFNRKVNSKNNGRILVESVTIEHTAIATSSNPGGKSFSSQEVPKCGVRPLVLGGASSFLGGGVVYTSIKYWFKRNLEKNTFKILCVVGVVYLSYNAIEFELVERRQF